jgi:hypothetical protein
VGQRFPKSIAVLFMPSLDDGDGHARHAGIVRALVGLTLGAGVELVADKSESKLSNVPGGAGRCPSFETRWACFLRGSGVLSLSSHDTIPGVEESPQ